MAAEWGAYTDDILAALAPLGVQLAAAPLAPGGAAVCQCTTGPTCERCCSLCWPAPNRLKRCCATDGRAGSSGSSSQAEYLRSALRERPGLFSRATYFAAHAYPTNCNAPLSDPANLPKEIGGNASWMSSVKATRQLGEHDR